MAIQFSEAACCNNNKANLIVILELCNLTEANLCNKLEVMVNKY